MIVVVPPKDPGLFGTFFQMAFHSLHGVFKWGGSNHLLAGMILQVGVGVGGGLGLDYIRVFFWVVHKKIWPMCFIVWQFFGGSFVVRGFWEWKRTFLF